MARLVNFTQGEGRALRHFLRHSPEAVRAIVGDRWPALWINAHCAELSRTLGLPAPFACLHREPERAALDLAILAACVTHSDYHRSRPWTVDGRENAQAYNGAVRCLWNARAKLVAAYGIEPEFPQT